MPSTRARSDWAAAATTWSVPTMAALAIWYGVHTISAINKRQNRLRSFIVLLLWRVAEKTGRSVDSNLRGRRRAAQHQASLISYSAMGYARGLLQIGFPCRY